MVAGNFKNEAGNVAGKQDGVKCFIIFGGKCFGNMAGSLLKDLVKKCFYKLAGNIGKKLEIF